MKALRAVRDFVAGAAALVAMAYLPPNPDWRGIQLQAAARQAQTLARLDSLNAALHAGEARAWATIAEHHADRARRALRATLWAAPIAAGIGAWVGFEVGAWMS